MSGTVPLLLIYAFVAWTGTGTGTSFFNLPSWRLRMTGKKLGARGGAVG